MGGMYPYVCSSFAGPGVGNLRFRDRLDELGVKVLRVVNVHDKMPMIPGIILNECVPSVLQKLFEMSPWCYSHVGVELALDHKKSPFLKETNDPVCIHNLEGLFHLLDGYHSKDSRFRLASRRDIALVNKTCDFLKDHFLVPPNWWETENRGLIRDTAGHWMQPQRHDIGDHLHT
ncbi:hypothetical protein F0562_000414 [Nyssa sinensis]|uniref:Fungal lipase-type domain-containing protein n=1 Tax=Nyssa sinensis TaxID=561372 RepID=A0A5J5C3M6_9ASTE|nr:hypothetical protein F0562_000414 [Nyssa sinensis]